MHVHREVAEFMLDPGVKVKVHLKCGKGEKVEQVMGKAAVTLLVFAVLRCRDINSTKEGEKP